MHSYIRLFLLLFTYLPCALSKPHPSSAKHPDKRTGCHQSLSPRHAFIFFRTNTEPDFDFGIQTKYTTYYPKSLESALRLDYFRPLVFTSIEECGWQKARSVHSTSWAEVGDHRGNIYWKYRDLHWVQHSGSKKGAHWVAASPDHIPPRTGTTPRNQTLNRIGRILEEIEPAADVYQLATIVLGYFCGFLSMISILLLAKYHVNAR